ncbi:MULTISPECIES: hypothetical protein [unclassified Sphingosinithalassobacter]|uniref:hypothetical protein n=1 Tax=unclassified Sphingosinithalassobacter TaxID=2676235 RepID=UPI00165E1E71|nr:hypothetical protein [Sphingosinithalassobacter sp. CS137]
MTGELSPLASTTMALAVLAVFALAGGGSWMIAKQHDRTKGVLMLVCAAVVLGNVLIWVV